MEMEGNLTSEINNLKWRNKVHKPREGKSDGTDIKENSNGFI